jgi:hypothetical protein
MDVSPRERVQGLVSEASALLEAEQPREAALVFERVLLQDPAHEEARRGLVLARARAGELERELEEKLQVARDSAAAGDLPNARGLLQEVIRLGGDRDRAHDMLDRLDERGGIVAAPGQEEPAAANAPPSGRARRPARAWWTRTTFATVCGIAFAAVTTTVAASWELLLGRLERRPSPAGYAVSTLPLPPAPPGERALAEARQRLDRGDVSGALSALADIRPDDPVYPFALQLRQRAEMASTAPASARREAQ